MTIKETPGETPFLYFSRFSFSPTYFLPCFPAGSVQSLLVPGGSDIAQGAGVGLGFAFLFVVSSSFPSCLLTPGTPTAFSPSGVYLLCRGPPWAGPFRERWASGNFLKMVEGNAMSCTWQGCFHLPAHGGHEQSCREVPGCPDGPRATPESAMHLHGSESILRCGSQTTCPQVRETPSPPWGTGKATLEHWHQFWAPRYKTAWSELESSMD